MRAKAGEGVGNGENRRSPNIAATPDPVKQPP